MDRQSAKELILSEEPTFLLQAPKMDSKGRPTYVCPNCRNGSGEHGTGISLDDDDKGRHYHCFKCGLHEDVIGLWKKDRGIADNDNSRSVWDSLYSYYNINISIDGKAETPTPVDKRQSPPPETSPADYMAFYKECYKNITGAEEYLQRRGISLETAKKFKLGYAENWRHPKAPNAPPSPRLIIPTDCDSYLARDIRTNLTPEQEKYCKSKVGSSKLFNINILKSATKPIIVTEGELDALSIIEVGGEAIGLGSTNNYNKLLDALEEARPKCPLILALDNDDAGIKATDYLAEALTKRQISFYRLDLYGDCKDANESLTADKERFTKAVAEAESKTDPPEGVEEKPKLQIFNADDLMAMDIPDPTYLVDEWLPDTGLAILSGASKIGKSWLCLLLALKVSTGSLFLNRETQESGVLYLALEDSPRTLRPRLRKLLNGGTAPKSLHLVFEAPTVDGGGLDALDSAVKQYPDTKLIIIDVLTLFRSFNAGAGKNAYERDYNTLAPLKQWADSHEVCILAITHTRKAKDDGDVFDRISGSAGQMAVSDATWMLYKENRTDPNAYFEITGRSVRGGSYILTLDKDTCIWDFQCERDDLETMLGNEYYKNSPVIQTIKLLLGKAPDHKWTGRATALIDAGHIYLDKTIAASPKDASAEITKYTEKLRRDGIAYKKSDSGRYTIYRMNDGKDGKDAFEDLGTDETGETAAMFS